MTEPGASTPTSALRLSRLAVGVLATVVALACFGLGFTLAFEQGGEPDSATPTSAPSEPSTTRQMTTTAPTSTAPTTSMPTTSMPTTVVTTGSSSAPSSTAPPASAVGPPPTPTPTPPAFDVTWPRDPSTGEMVLREGSPSAVIIQNIGGSAGSFTVQGSGFVTVGSGGVVTGVLQPGEVRSIPLVAGTGVSQIPPPHGVISVYGASGLLVTISVVIVS